MNGRLVLNGPSVRLSDTNYRETRPQEVDAYISEGKVPVDVVCAQGIYLIRGNCDSLLTRDKGGEGGGHTGEIPFSILIPACVDAAKSRKSPLTGEPVMVVAAGTSCLSTFERFA